VEGALPNGGAPFCIARGKLFLLAANARPLRKPIRSAAPSHAAVANCEDFPGGDMVNTTKMAITSYKDNLVVA
jgi:hypothetical protein